MLGGIGWAQTLVIPYDQAKPGATFDLSVLLTANILKPFNSTQFDLVLPSGFTVVSARRGNNLPISYSLMNAGGVRSILLDNSGGAVPVMGGEVAIYTLRAPTTLADYTIGLSNIIASNSTGSASVPVGSAPGTTSVKNTMAVPTIPVGIGAAK